MLGKAWLAIHVHTLQGRLHWRIGLCLAYAFLVAGGDAARDQPFTLYSGIVTVVGLVSLSPVVYCLGLLSSANACMETRAGFLGDGRERTCAPFARGEKDNSKGPCEEECLAYNQETFKADMAQESKARIVVGDDVNPGEEKVSKEAPTRSKQPSQTKQTEDSDVDPSEMNACTVLEWRLVGHYRLGDETKSILSGRSCSICGWMGCDECPRTQTCVADGRPPIRVDYTGDPNSLNRADVVLLPATGDFERYVWPNKRDQMQAFVAIAGESSMWWPHVETLMDDTRFDLVMGYSRSLSHMHASYLPHNYTALQKRERLQGEDLDISQVVPTADIVHFASNCHSALRQEWVEELMRHMPVDSYGPCNNNKALPETLAELERIQDRDDAGMPGRTQYTTRQAVQSVVKRAVLSRYKFGLAFENTRDHDYVTEKLFEVLMAGAVPIYMGAPNWREFFPFPEAVIDASDFDSPEDLAHFLQRISANETKYKELHEWRNRPLPTSVRSLEATSFKWNLCRVCRWWHENFLPDIRAENEPA